MSGSENKYNNPFSATLKGISDLFRKRERIGRLGSEEKLVGKKVLITGSSSGLGLATAGELARLGAVVIMAVRSGIPEKGEEVKAVSDNPDVHMLPLDLADFDSVRELVKNVKNRFGSIDILICNAGMVPGKARLTKHGLEEMFSVNYLAKFVLVNLALKENLFNTGGETNPRIIFVSSESHRNPEAFEWDTFGVYRKYGMGKSVERYGYYKLLLTTFAYELSRRLNRGNETGFSVFAHCPGPVNSNIAREASGILQPLVKLIFGIFFRSPEVACETPVYQAASGQPEGLKWDYLFMMSRVPVDEKASDPENGRMLWEKTERLLREKGIAF